MQFTSASYSLKVMYPWVQFPLFPCILVSNCYRLSWQCQGCKWKLMSIAYFHVWEAIHICKNYIPATWGGFLLVIGVACITHIPMSVSCVTAQCSISRYNRLTRACTASICMSLAAGTLRIICILRFSRSFLVLSASSPRPFPCCWASILAIMTVCCLVFEPLDHANFVCRQ